MTSSKIIGGGVLDLPAKFTQLLSFKLAYMFYVGACSQEFEPNKWTSMLLPQNIQFLLNLYTILAGKLILEQALPAFATAWLLH